MIIDLILYSLRSSSNHSIVIPCRKRKKVAKLCDTQMIIAHTCILQIQNYLENNTAEDICENSSKIIQFIDVPGHQKYLKTTIFGLMGHSPHFAMLVMSANTGIGM